MPFDILLCLQMSSLSCFHILRFCCKQGHLLFFFFFFFVSALSITEWKHRDSRVERRPADSLGGWLGGWLACLSETSEMWFTLWACCSEPYPTLCIFSHCLWQLVVSVLEEWRWRGRGTKQASDFAFQWLSSGVRSTSGLLGALCVRWVYVCHFPQPGARAGAHWAHLLPSSRIPACGF